MQLHAGSPEEAGMLPAQIELTRQRLKQWSEEGVTPALVVLAARRGVIVLHEALGRLGPSEDSPPVQLDALFPLASISKVITATAIMTLVEDGLLGLSRRVQEYVPQFVGEGKEQVMVHHLLTHTSGLRDTVVGAHAESKKDKVTIPLPEADQHPEIHEYLYLESDAPLSEPPGREMSYSNTGYLLLGEIIRRVSGKGFGHFVTERIFEPLGMHDSFFFVPKHARDRVVRRSADLPFARISRRSVVPRATCCLGRRVFDRFGYGCLLPDVPQPRQLRSGPNPQSTLSQRDDPQSDSESGFKVQRGL